MALVAAGCAVASPALFASGRGGRASQRFLIAIADDWSYGHAGAYGCKWVKTPAFDRVAQQGLLCTHAFTPNAKMFALSWRACILTRLQPLAA